MLTDSPTKKMKTRKKQKDTGTDNLPAFFSLEPLYPNSWRVSGLLWKTILIIWKCGSSSPHCGQCVPCSFPSESSLDMGLVALFSKDCASSMSYYTGPLKYNLSDPCHHRTTWTSLRPLKSTESRVPLLRGCRPVGPEQDDTFWPGTQPACKVVRLVAPVGLWETCETAVAVCAIQNDPTLTNWCAVEMRWQKKPLKLQQWISTFPAINSYLFGLKPCGYLSSSPPFASPCSCEFRNTGWGMEG